MIVTKEFLQPIGKEIEKPTGGAGADGVQNFDSTSKIASWRLREILGY